MFPQSSTQALDRIWRVAHWKWELDPDTPWHRRAFFKYIFRPFIHFSWSVVKIPCPKGMEVEVANGKARMFWFEDGGSFTSKDAADLACTGEWHGYKETLVDRRFDPRSAQISSLVFPRQKNPRQHRPTPTFNTILKDRKQDEAERKQLADYLAQLNQVLDR